MGAAWKRGKANKGSAGVDGLSIEQTYDLLKTQWPRIRSELLRGTYRPQAVRRVEIPKPTGETRELEFRRALIGSSRKRGSNAGRR